MIDVSDSITDLKNTQIGIRKDTLEISRFDFAKSPISLISSQDVTMLDKFIPSLGQVFQNMYNVELFMIDGNEVIKDSATFKNYYNSNYNEVYAKLEELSNTDLNKNYVFLILGIEGFMNSFDLETQRKIKTLFSNLKNKKNIRVILADAVSKLKAFEYEDFYRNCVQPIYAIWLGSGITDQYTIKSSTYTRETRGQIPTDFGYNVDRGNATLIKLLDFYTQE